MKSNPPLQDRIRRARRALRFREPLADRIALARRMADRSRKGQDGKNFPTQPLIQQS